jgi:hypothetical protein
MSYYLPPGQEPPAGGIPSDTPGGSGVPVNVAGRRRQRPGGRKPGGGGYGYQNFTQYAQGIKAQPNQYESDVLGGKYLDVKNNPYVQGYTNALQKDWRESLGQGLSQVSSPFLSGSTLGQTGIHAATRQNFGNEAMEDLNDQLAKSYFGLYTQERGSQDTVNQGISGRTNQLVGAAGSAYGADRQLQGVKVQANSALQQARMAQQLGYDKLAADLMIQYEQLNQQASDMDRLISMGYGNLVGQYMQGFGSQDSTQTQQGPKTSQLGGFLQGAAGGVLGGAGIGQMFGAGGGGGGYPGYDPYYGLGGGG